MLRKLPTDYTKLTPTERRKVREIYVVKQEHRCFYCNRSLLMPPPKTILDKDIDWELFPENFLRNPIHLQHNHKTNMTEGAVHAYCNAVMWQYDGR